MESDIFDVIENALVKAGYKIMDGEYNSIFIRHPNSDDDYEIKVTETPRVYRVRYEDNNGCNDSTETYDTEDEAEAAIEEEMETVIGAYSKIGLNYNYYDYGTNNGMITEVYVPGQDLYTRWCRLWKE